MPVETPIVPAAAEPTADQAQALLALATAPLDPHAQLLKMMLPRARHLCIYSPELDLLWQGEGMEPTEMRSAAHTVLSGPLGHALSFDGAAEPANDAMIYTFCLREETGRPLAAVCFFVPGTREARPFSLVLSLVRPALEVLQRELLLRSAVQRMSSERPGEASESDALVELATLEGQVDDLAGLVEAALRPLGAHIGALVVPDKGLALLRTARVAEGEEITGSPDAPRLVSALHRHLLNYARMNQQALVGSTRADDPGGSHRVLSLPIRRRGQRVVGFLAFFALPGAPAFGVRALRVGEWVARRVCELLDQRYDANTGLPLRVEFERQAELVCSAVGVHQLLFVDVDHLQAINEAFGLHVGDEVLLRVAEVARRRTPRSGVCARLDGDRMVICLPLTTAAAAETAAQELCASVAELSYVRGEGKVNIGVSIGVASLTMHEGSSGGWHEGLARALAFAEAACRQAKAAGCGRFHRWLETTPPIAMHAVAAIDAPILERLRRVIASESPTFLAQSLLPLQGYGDPRFELLLRLPMGEGELLVPDKFLPLAARAGLLPAVDRWVIRNVIKLLAGQSEVMHRRVARFSVNLSAATLATPTAAGALLEDLEELLVSTGLPPDVLVFDIPISELAPGSSAWTAALPTLQRLRMLGCGVALDNCTGADAEALGTHALPLTELKLDGNRVRAMLDDAHMDSDVRAALQWAASRGLDTVAKCVETEALRLRVQELGCVYGQGFEMGRPLPLAHVLEDLSMYDMLATVPDVALDA